MPRIIHAAEDTAGDGLCHSAGVFILHGSEYFRGGSESGGDFLGAAYA